MCGFGERGRGEDNCLSTVRDGESNRHCRLQIDHTADHTDVAVVVVDVFVGGEGEEEQQQICLGSYSFGSIRPRPKVPSLPKRSACYPLRIPDPPW